MAAPQIILDLVDRFESNLEAYTSGHYNETQLRREFLDPFFTALGWDVANVNGNAEMYKDVIHEDAIKIGGATKAPDYCFQIGGMRKFFLEAKKPSINLKDDINPAFQLRRYAWSAKLPLSILTDFEEFAIYDGRVKPNQGDKPNIARIHYFTYKQYADQWDKIAAIFSRDAVLKGSFDKFAGGKGRRGTAAVDQAFLESISEWRKELAQNLALRNPKLSQHELNYAVQKILDRILFLRICEDRGIENYGRLQGHVNGVGVYKRLCETFQQADERYNSGLFHFQKEKGRSGYPDELTLNLEIDDNLLKHIIKQLYYPESPYEFSVFTADILGQVYEQFLGKVIRLTEGHHAKIEEKPEVKKAGGVYYTPTYIVDYIVNNTVGKLLEGKTPKQAANLKILDPACGSGSFLIGAYQKLLDWHRNFYIKDGIEKWSKGKRTVIFQGRDNDWHLTTSERKRILTNNIFGVDIDSQAVEVTKLSLLLKVLEGESNRTLVHQFKLFHERALPDLSDNIKCGNSLIGPDYFSDRLMPDPEELQLVNPFDWKHEFSEIMEAGGFDCVIGNPPWGADFNESELKYHRIENQEIIVRMIDSFMYFIYQGLKKIKSSGRFGMILPDVAMYQNDNEKLREFILNEFKINLLLNMGDVFEKVTRPACILILENRKASGNRIIITDVSQIEKNQKKVFINDPSCFNSILQEDIYKFPGRLFITSNPDQYSIWSKVQSVPHELLEDLVDEDGIQRGVSPDLKKAFLIDSEIVRKRRLEKAKIRKVLTGGKQVKRYSIEYPDLWLIYTTAKDSFKELPNICAHIDQYKNEVTCKEVRQKKHPLYSLHRPRKENIFLKDKKILGVITEDEIIVALDIQQTFATDGLYLFGLREKKNTMYLMGILNSKLFVFIYRLLTLESGRVLPQVKPTILRKLPIISIDFTNPIVKGFHDRIVLLVERMIGLYKKLQTLRVNHEKTLIQRQIDAMDKEIDRLVYELYGLTEVEIKIVEGESSK